MLERRKRSVVAAVAWGSMASLALIGCGDSNKERGVEVAANTPVGGDTTIGASLNTTIITPVSYDDAESAYTAKRFDEAVTKFTGYTVTKPENPWGHYMLGLSAWKTHELGLAESELLKAIELDSMHVKSRFNLTRVYLDKGEPGEAVKQIEAGVKLDSTSGEGFRLLGRVRDELGMFPEAEESYRAAIKIDSTDAWAMNNLGLNLIKQGKFEGAVEALTQVTVLKPESPTFQNNLGMALELNGRLTDAAKAYQAAIDLDSSYQKAIDNLARVKDLKDRTEVKPN